MLKDYDYIEKVIELFLCNGCWGFIWWYNKMISKCWKYFLEIYVVYFYVIEL